MRTILNADNTEITKENLDKLKTDFELKSYSELQAGADQAKEEASKAFRENLKKKTKKAYERSFGLMNELREKLHERNIKEAEENRAEEIRQAKIKAEKEIQEKYIESGAFESETRQTLRYMLRNMDGDSDAMIESRVEAAIKEQKEQEEETRIQKAYRGLLNGLK